MKHYQNVFQDGKFPADVADMSGLRWLRLNKTNLNKLPSELGQLEKLVSNVSFVFTLQCIAKFIKLLIKNSRNLC